MLCLSTEIESFVFTPPNTTVSVSSYVSVSNRFLDPGDPLISVPACFRKHFIVNNFLFTDLNMLH